jgi:hypothetical protein
MTQRLSITSKIGRLLAGLLCFVLGGYCSQACASIEATNGAPDARLEITIINRNRLELRTDGSEPIILTR